MPSPITAANTLLVEGKDDLHIVANLCETAEIPDNAFRIKEKEGYDNLVADLQTELDASGLHCLGILVDADLDIAQRWTALRNQLLAKGYVDVPRVPDPEGTIVRHPQTKPLVGVWIMPDNMLPGMIEDFVADLVPPEDILWPHVQACIERLPASDKRFPDRLRSKASIHTWLAWQKEPGKPMGQAIGAKYLAPGAPVAQRFLAWLNRLYQL